MNNSEHGIEPYLQNRELSWLKFNERVLHEATRTQSPLLERLKFISIFSSNLDEFFMVRVGTIVHYMQFDKTYRDNKTGMNAKEQLAAILQDVAPLYSKRDKAYKEIIDELSEKSVHLLRMNELAAEDLKLLKKHFAVTVMPLLSPQIIDSRHPFPHIPNKQAHVSVVLEGKKKHHFGLVPIPTELDCLVPISSDNRFVLLEDLVHHFVDRVFDVYEVTDKNIITVTRNTDIDSEIAYLDEDVDYRLSMKQLLKKRQRLSPVRLEFAYKPRTEIHDFLCDKLALPESQVFTSKTPLDLSFCFSLERLLADDLAKELTWPPHVPARTISADKKTHMVKYFSQQNDFLLAYPFESMSPFLSLVLEAAEDPEVLSIKITLYRIDHHSRLAESLILAAENGKEVVVLMELRARFDEDNNISWAQRMEEAGCRVVFGHANYKVHSKICLITRKAKGGIQYISHLGTGNFSEKTSKLYTDFSLITTSNDLGADLSNLFNNLLIGNLEGSYAHLWVSPSNLKSGFLDLLEKERQKALNGGEAQVIIKCNSLTDREVIDRLVEASQAGVKIDMIVRGICCLTPQIKGVTDNIRIKSIVGRFLEHSRVYCFGAGEDFQLYISSADLMTRNTERRVEVACPIYCPDQRKRVKDMLSTMLADNAQSWNLQSDGSYQLRTPAGGEEPINSQMTFVKQAQDRAKIAATEAAITSTKTAIPKPTGEQTQDDFYEKLESLLEEMLTLIREQKS